MIIGGDLRMHGVRGASKKEVASITNELPFGANIQNFLRKAEEWREDYILKNGGELYHDGGNGPLPTTDTTNPVGRGQSARTKIHFAQAPQVVILGDSYFAGTWPKTFRSWLLEEYKIPINNVKIYGYGGTNITAMFPWIFDATIGEAPDLIIFGEFESIDKDDKYLKQAEEFFQKLHDECSSDVIVMSRGLDRNTAFQYLLYKQFSNSGMEYLTYRGGYFDKVSYLRMAAQLGFEVVDTIEPFIDLVDRLGVPGDVPESDPGYTTAEANHMSSLFADTVHLTDYGYEQAFLDVLKKRIIDAKDICFLNLSNRAGTKAELIHCGDYANYDRYTNELVTNTGSWSYIDDGTANAALLTSSTANNTVDVDLNDIIGFEVLHGENCDTTLTLSNDGGSNYYSPSNSVFFRNSYPLQHITPIRAMNREEDSSWSLTLPFRSGVVNSNFLADGTHEFGRFKIECTDASASPPTFEMFDPFDNSMGTFDLGDSFTPNDPTAWADTTSYSRNVCRLQGGTIYRCLQDHTSAAATNQPGSGSSWEDYWRVDYTGLWSDLYFPATRNGEDNYFEHPTHDFDTGTCYEFAIKNDTADTLLVQQGDDLKDKAIIRLSDGTNDISYDEDTGIFSWTTYEDSGTHDDILIPYFSVGDRFRLEFEQLSITGDTRLRCNEGGETFVLQDNLGKGDVVVFEQVLTDPSVKIIKLSGIGTVTFRLSVRNLAPDQELEGIKRITGLTRGDYKLRITNNSRTDLWGVKALR